MLAQVLNSSQCMCEDICWFGLALKRSKQGTPVRPVAAAPPAAVCARAQLLPALADVKPPLADRLYRGSQTLLLTCFVRPTAHKSAY